MTKNKNTKETKLQKEEIVIKEIEEPEKQKNPKIPKNQKQKKTKKSKKYPITDLDEILGISETREDTDFGDVPEFLKQTKKKNKEEIPDFMKY